MFKIILIVIAVAVAAVLIYAAFQPDHFRVERSAVIKAPPARVFALINDFHAWRQWSPWENIDPALKRDYSGAISGAGAVYAWQGNSKVGEGRMQILESTPPSMIRIKLDFLKPFAAHNTADFSLQDEGGATRVTWAMYGPNSYLAKLMHLCFNMDKMLGGMFDQGLAQLKELAEKRGGGA